MSKHSTRHYCRNTHCRAKLAAPVDNEHHAFCTSGCHAIFYRHRCLVCENAMRRKSERQRFGSGHKICQNEYQRFPHVFDYPGANPAAGSTSWCSDQDRRSRGLFSVQGIACSTQAK
jgi:hypothetical protein